MCWPPVANPIDIINYDDIMPCTGNQKLGSCCVRALFLTIDKKRVDAYIVPVIIRRQAVYIGNAISD